MTNSWSHLSCCIVRLYSFLLCACSSPSSADVCRFIQVCVTGLVPGISPSILRPDDSLSAATASFQYLTSVDCLCASWPVGHFVWNAAFFAAYITHFHCFNLLLNVLILCFPTGAWETSRSMCPEDPVVSMRPVQVPAVAPVMQDLPGTATEDVLDDRPSFHNTHFDQYRNSTAGGVITSSPKLRRGVNSTKSN